MSGLPRKLVRNTASSAAAYFINLAFALLLTPYILTRLGVEVFGVWIILSITVSYLGMLDGGVGTAFIKHLTDAETKGELQRRNEIVTVGWLYYLGFCVVLLVVGAVLEEWILSFLKITAQVSAIYWGVIGILIIRSLFMVFRSFLYALHRLDVLNVIAVSSGFMNAILTFAALSMGYGLIGLVAAGLVSAGCHVLAEVLMAYRCSDGLKIQFPSAPMNVIRPLFRYGIQLQASRVAEMIHLHVDKILLSRFVGLGVVTMYDLGSKMAGPTRSFPMILLPAILPAASELEARQDRRRLRQLYERGSKYLAVMVFPLCCFTVLTAETIMAFWLGTEDFNQAVLALRVLAVAYMFYILMGMGTAVARGIGVVQYELRAVVVSALLNILLSLLLVRQMGLAGVLIGTAVSTMIGYVYFTLSFHAHMKISMGDFTRSVYLVPLLGTLLAAAAVIGIGYPLELWRPFADTRAVMLLLLLIKGSLFVIIYGGIVLKAQYVAMADVLLVRKAFLSPG